VSAEARDKVVINLATGFEDTERVMIAFSSASPRSTRSGRC